jgi:hypothetical protein
MSVKPRARGVANVERCVEWEVVFVPGFSDNYWNLRYFDLVFRMLQGLRADVEGDFEERSF